MVPLNVYATRLIMKKKSLKKQSIEKQLRDISLDAIEININKFLSIKKIRKSKRIFKKELLYISR